MKLIKFLTVFLLISIAFSSLSKNSRNLKKRRLDQINSGICGFVGVLEAALDHGVNVKGVNANEKKLQEYVPGFVKLFLKDNVDAAKSVFKQTNEFLDRFMPTVNKSVHWFCNYQDMISGIKEKYDRTKKEYSHLVGVFLSYENLKKVAEYAGLTIDDVNSHSTSSKGPINKPISAAELKLKKSCLVGISKPDQKWISGDDLYVDPPKNFKNISTQHWIYISKNEMLVNWNQKIDLNDPLATATYISNTLNSQDLTIITEALCLK